MSHTTIPLEQLKSFLNQLFQFDSQDLDFGVYKILHYKRKEIASFVDQLLVDKVKIELQTLSDDEVKQIKEQIAELEKDDIIKGWLQAESDEKKTLEKFGKDKITLYKDLKAKTVEASVSVETENQIYNHLTLFFSRYYDKGDFISKRRFGKNEKYMVPYNGEETHFHWANHDQYYIKSSETFNQYAFKAQTSMGELVVNFKLHNAQLEQGNVKADEPNFFILSDKSPEVNDNEFTIYFEYRPLSDDDKKKVKGNSKQDALDESTFELVKKQFGTNLLLANLWKPTQSKADGVQEGKPLLLKKLHHYTRKNKHDFFIHKNLKSFLTRELDYYIKSELVNVDDLYITDSDTHFDRLRHNLKTIKVFKSIADTIIDFVSQIEDFQKKLWEKKKFVLSTEWVITVDRLVEYIGEEAAKPILEEVIKNKKQVEEWKELFGEKALPKKNDDFKADLHAWKKLSIDSGFFSTSFKQNLLNLLADKISLSEKLDGQIFNSDNYHGLHLLNESYVGKINNVYIDPPYNTSASEIIYKNSFKHSSWNTLIENRVEIGKPLLHSAGNLCVTIDDVEMPSLSMIMSKVHGPKNIAGVIAIRANPSGRPNEAGLAIAHEYAIFAKGSIDSKIKKLPRTDAQLQRYNEMDETSIYEWRNFRREGSNSNREDGKRQWYPIYANLNDGTIRIPNMEWSDDTELWVINEKPSKEEKEIWPITDEGLEKNWRWSEENVRNDYNQFHTRFNNRDVPQVYYKFRPNTDGITPLTFWQDAKYSATEHGTKTLKNLFNHSKFSYPKSIWAVKDCLYIMGNERNSVNLDYFPGSGTTFHAVQLLNKDDDGIRKCILIEQGHYFNTIIIPRIKKVAFTFDWKDGKPKNGSMNGLGVFFKYQRLEQYEEALENIAFKASEDTLQKALEFDQYIPKYFLEFETKGSKTLVNTEAMKDPWDYKLKVWDGFTYDTEQAVDLVETFNYLIGLHMQKCITKELNGKKYQFVLGHNNANKNILVVWRSVKDWSLDDYKADAAALKEELKSFSFDLLYINDQAHIDGYQPVEEVFRNKMLP